MAGIKLISGRLFGRLIAVAPIRRAKERGYNWFCLCSCGTFVTVLGSNLLRGRTKSCGCLNREKASQSIKRIPLSKRMSSLSHGHTKGGHRTPEYSSYAGAKKRCNNSNTPNYADYGGRGIKFLFKSFEEGYAELGERPEPKYLFSVNRINNDGNYEAGNVEWATNEEQLKNRRSWDRHKKHTKVKTCCKYGHPRTPETVGKQGGCKTCAVEQQQKRRMRRVYE